MNRKAYGFDLNPFAYVLSKAKSKNLDKQLLLLRLREWEKNYKNNFKDYSRYFNDDLLTFYSTVNLEQLVFIQQNYGKYWEKMDDLDNFILAIILGIMHGPIRKDGSSLYFSLGMSNTTSMSINYVKKYALKNNLTKPSDDIFYKIRTRIEKIFSHKSIANLKTDDYNIAKIKIVNALNIYENWDQEAPKLIFTSPPYLNIINYTKQNWLKMWLLGYETNEECKDIGLDDKHNFSNYKKFMEQYLLNICKIINNETTIILVIGDVIKQEKITYSFEDIWKDLKLIVPLKLVELYTDEINQNKKSTNAMGTRKGRATRIDKMYVFKKK